MPDELQDDEPLSPEVELALETTLKPILGAWIRKRQSEGASAEQILAENEMLYDGAEIAVITGVNPGKLGQA